MNSDDTPINPAAPAGDAAAEAAPKRRRSTRAKADETGAVAAPAAAAGVEPAAAEDKPVKPRAPRKTAAAKAAAADAETAAAPPAEVAAETGADEAAPKRRAPRKSAKVADGEPSAAAPQAPAAEPQPAAVRADAGEGAVQGGDAAGATGGEARSQAVEAAGAGDAGEGEEREGRGGRNRRRGRRGRGASGEFGGDQPQEGREASGAAEQQPSTEQVSVEAEERFAQLLAGEFDVAEEAGGAAESGEVQQGEEQQKRVLAPEPDAPKLQKVLAQAGVGSRRDIEEMIAEGKIEVNGEVAHIGQRISFGDRVFVNGKPIKVRISPPAPRILAYHKPVGEVVTFNDPEGRPTVFRHLPRLQQGKWQSVGRLDLNTEGLLLFTNSGELANQLMHPRFGVEREYAVRVLGSLNEEQRQRLLEGVEIEGQKAGFKSVVDGGGEGANRWYRVIITEGRNREVRKLFDAVGLAVSRLIRIRYGTVVLPRGLKRGVWVELSEGDVRLIRRLAGGGDGRQREAQQPQRDEQQRGGKDRNKPRRGNGPRPSRPEPSPRAAQDEQRYNEGRPRDEDFEDDVDEVLPSHINPLEQTFDRRFASNKRSFPAGFGAGGSGQGGGRGGGGNKQQRNKGAGGGPREPDPMQTSIGYIGADAFLRRGGGGGGGGGGRGGKRRR